MAHPVAERIEKGLAGKLGEITVKSQRRIYIDVPPENLVEAARYIWGELRARYAIATGTHHPDRFEVLHHFAFDGDGVIVSLRVRAEGDPPEVDSITPVIKGAGFIEREMHDLLGINFKGHPNLVRLILPEDWPDGLYPLRREVPLDGNVEVGK